MGSLMSRIVKPSLDDGKCHNQIDLKYIESDRENVDSRPSEDYSLMDMELDVSLDLENNTNMYVLVSSMDFPCKNVKNYFA